MSEKMASFDIDIFHCTPCPEINILDIFYCSLKKNYQILVIFDQNVSDTTGH